MDYNYKEKKIVGVIGSNVEPSIALNVIGHLAISIGAYADKDIMGQANIKDKSGVNHVGISKYPFIITKVKMGKVRQAIETAKQNPNILVVDYPKEMLTTAHDEELVKAMEEKEEQQLEYLGAVLYGDAKDIDEITGKFQLWRID
ncbi:MAG: DUF2000 domain-containing protein [Oscillospiraceae bacterium]|nr:DUF2000 domain-containing protein [Oscillospiraceae bacterium]